jgi:hypothetical protein
MTTTRKKHVTKGAKRVTKRKRNKVKKKGYSSYFSSCLGICVKTNCVSVYPYETDSITDIIPDIYFKDLADELLHILQNLFMKGHINTEAYDAMMIGYTCIIESKYRDAVAFLNKGIDMV